MRCEQFEERLQGLLDRRAIPSHDRALRAHASACSHCRRMLRWEEEVADYLGDDGESASVDFSDCVMARLARGSVPRGMSLSQRFFQSGRGVSRSLGLAAAAVLVVSVGLFWQSGPRGAADAQPETHRPAMVADSASRTLGLRQESEEALPAGATRELVSLARGRLEGADEVAATVAGDLSPWARSIGGALATLTGRGSSSNSAAQRSAPQQSP